MLRVANRWTSSYWVFVDVVLEVPFFECSVWKHDPAKSMLNAIDPFSLVNASIGPEHLAVSVSFVVKVISFVNISTRPSEDSFSLLFVNLIITIVGVAVLVTLLALPLTLSVLLPFQELASVVGSSWPGIFSSTVSFSVIKDASIRFSCGKGVSALSVLQAHVPLTFISISVWPGMNAISMSFGVLPLADV
jgi:hypothetical protein